MNRIKENLIQSTTFNKGASGLVCVLAVASIALFAISLSRGSPFNGLTQFNKSIALSVSVAIFILDILWIKALYNVHKEWEQIHTNFANLPRVPTNRKIETSPVPEPKPEPPAPAPVTLVLEKPVQKHASSKFEMQDLLPKALAEVVFSYTDNPRELGQFCFTNCDLQVVVKDWSFENHPSITFAHEFWKGLGDFDTTDLAPIGWQQKLAIMARSTMLADKVENNRGIIVLTMPKGLSLRQVVNTFAPKLGLALQTRVMNQSNFDDAVGKSYRVILTNGLLAGSTNSSFRDQQQVLNPILSTWTSMLEMAALVISLKAMNKEEFSGVSRCDDHQWGIDPDAVEESPGAGHHRRGNQNSTLCAVVGGPTGPLEDNILNMAYRGQGPLPNVGVVGRFKL